tara:strand:- start:541 stop:816 length:276 start_codon:yes stop_codon:yes gene_type:complete
MKKPRRYSFYIILGLPVAIITVVTNYLGLSGGYNILAGLIMTLYCMFSYFTPHKKNNLALIASSFFLSIGFVMISTLFVSIPLWMIVLGFK